MHASDYCFMRLNKLVCINIESFDRKRYDLPPHEGNLIGLVPSPDGTKYVMETSGKCAFCVQLLDSNFKVLKDLTLLQGNKQPSISWLRDGQSLLVKQDETFSLYSIASGRMRTLITKSSNPRALELANGRIAVMWHDYKKGFDDVKNVSGLTMKPDGSDIRDFDAPVSHFGTPQVYYDRNFDRWYVLAYISGGSVLSVWGSDSAGNPTRQELNMPVAFASDVEDLVGLSKDTVAYMHDNRLEFISIKQAKAVKSTDKTGVPVGLFASVNIQLANPQLEGKYDRIMNLASAPADFQTFIKQQFDSDDAKCVEGEAMYSIGKVVRDTFADVGQGCHGGAEYYYKKINGQWTLVMSAQQGPECIEVNRYTFTKEIIPICNTANSSEPNQNP